MPRKTRCLTYGAWTHRCERVKLESGYAIICTGEDSTLCGKEDDEAESPPFDALVKKKPAKTCAACWRVYVKDLKQVEL